MNPGSAPTDITARSDSMSRDSCILYPNRNPQGGDPPDYIGIMRKADGSLYWVAGWHRTVKGREVIEIQLKQKTPKNPIPS